MKKITNTEVRFPYFVETIGENDTIEKSYIRLRSQSLYK